MCLITSFEQVSQQSTPLSPECVGSSQTAVTSNHTQVGDSQLHQVVGRLHTTFPGSEVLATGTADDSSSLTCEERGETVFNTVTDTPTFSCLEGRRLVDNVFSITNIQSYPLDINPCGGMSVRAALITLWHQTH